MRKIIQNVRDLILDKGVSISKLFKISDMKSLTQLSDFYKKKKCKYTSASKANLNRTTHSTLFPAAETPLPTRAFIMHDTTSSTHST